MKKHLGLIYALAAFFFWGVFPIFWKQIQHIPILEIVAHRMLWSSVFLLGFIIISQQWRQFIKIFSQPKTLLIIATAAIVIATNWGIFIWGVNSGQIIEISLGYFINPLINVLLGMLLFKERLTPLQILALLIAACALLIMVLDTGGLPLISIALALSFAVYGVLKKQLSVAASHGLAMEMLVVVFPALIFLLYWHGQGDAAFLVNTRDSVYLILSGCFTLIPLLLFAAAAKRVSMATLGMTQYLGPSLQLLIAVFVYREAFEGGTRYAFVLTWLALLIYSFSGFLRKKRQDLSGNAAEDVSAAKSL